MSVFPVCDPLRSPPGSALPTVRRPAGPRVIWLALFLCSVLPLSQAAPPDDAEKRLASDVKLLQAAGVQTDGAGLVEFFRKQVVSEEQRRNIGELIKQLGDDSFKVREQASEKLIALGPAALPALQQALNHRDVEVARRAERCLNAFQGTPPGEVRAAAARVLTARQPPQAVEALLAFLPDAGPAEEDAIAGALTVLGSRDGKADPALVTALADKLPLRRAVAAEALAGAAPARAAVRKLLTDPVRAVRLHVAVALAYAGDKEAVPVLIDLVADWPGGQTREAEELLRRLGGAKAPRVGPGDKAAARKHYRDDWNAWWKEHSATVNLAQLDAGPPRKAKVSARASGTYQPDRTPDKPFDLDRPFVWNSGGYAPGWIEADLGASSRLVGIRLVVHQLPDGETTHEVWVSDEPIGEQRTKAKLAHTFKGPTVLDQPLKFDFPGGLSARYVQILTTASPSWVAWGPIEILAGRARARFVKDDGN